MALRYPAGQADACLHTAAAHMEICTRHMFLSALRLESISIVVLTIGEYQAADTVCMRLPATQACACITQCYRCQLPYTHCKR
jgi:hypothetical protein